MLTESVQEVQHDLPPQHNSQVPTGPEQQIQSYPVQTMQPYIQQPPYQQPYPGQTFLNQNNRAIYPVMPTPVVGVNDYFSHNVLVLVFCCLPIGIVGLMKSSECKNAIAAGDAARAKRLSSEAKTLAMAGFVCGFLLITLTIILCIVLYSELGLI